MAEPLAVDPTGLSAAAAKLAGLCIRLVGRRPGWRRLGRWSAKSGYPAAEHTRVTGHDPARRDGR